jgi:hypothetical protein
MNVLSLRGPMQTPRLYLYARVRTSLCTLHKRPRVQQATGIPCSPSLGETSYASLGRNAPRERRHTFSCRHPRRRVTRYPRDVNDRTIGGGVLDALPSRGMTTLYPSLPATNAKRLRKGANATKQSMPPLCRAMDCFASCLWPDYPCGVTEIRAQSRRPISTQSWVLRKSAMLTASQMPMAVNATVNASAATLASMR